ncbi:hypothetical protein OJAV_G00081740 [Oryzias javanicus]|uniref:Uncharacterized protein n=1 Tax=Oryzias javanicus TaxID=123683 RepID=A0A3S2M850_ORYJA|nr:hypothetical protein OJAV_G00081740 [Oryzias javanicus]
MDASCCAGGAPAPASRFPSRCKDLVRAMMTQIPDLRWEVRGSRGRPTPLLIIIITALPPFFIDLKMNHPTKLLRCT